MAVVNINKEFYNKNFVEEKKTGVIEFSAPWCVYCRRIGPAYNKISEEYGDKIIIGQVNIDEEIEISDAHNIDVIPTFMFLKDGQVVDSIVAPDSKAKLNEFIDNNMGL